MLESFIQVLDVESLAMQVVELAPKVVIALLVLIACRLVYKLTCRPLRRVLTRSGLDSILIRMLVDNVYGYAVWVFALVMAADQVGINVGAALAGIGVVGIAVGFAAQDTLSNIIAGFLVFIDKPFITGDWVEVSDMRGEVVEITMRTTRLRTRRNTYVVLPNKSIIDAMLINHSKHGSVRLDVPVGIAYKESIPAAREVILEALKGVKDALPVPPPAVVVSGLGASSVDLDIRVWIEDAPNQETIEASVVEASKIALDKAGIEIPFPHLQLFVDNVEDRVWERAEGMAKAS